MLLTIDELASYLKISRETLYKMAQKGAIPAIKVGSQWRFDQNDIDFWIENNKNKKIDSTKISKRILPNSSTDIEK